MKRTLLCAVTLCLTAISLTSCLGESEYLYSSLEMVNVLSSDRFKTDEGVIFNVVENSAASMPVDIKRMMISCDVIRNSSGKDGEYDIRLREFAEAKVSDPVLLGEADVEKVGNDVVQVSQGWMTKGYFNALLKVITLKDSEQEHTIDLVFNEQRSHQDTLFFQIRHNAFGDSLEEEDNHDKAFNVAGGYFSFPVEQYIPAGTSSIVIHLDWEWYKTYDSLFTLDREACQGNITYTP